MSLTLQETSNPIAFDEINEDIIFCTEKDTGKYEDEGIFNIVPNLKNGFDVCYVCGAMGSGKSYWTAEYAKGYRRIFDKNKIFVFSQKETDPAYDDNADLKIRKVKVDDMFLKKDIDITKMEEFHNSLLIFDDFMAFSNKKITEKICNIILQAITLGRQYKIYTVITSHLFYSTKNRDLYMNIQNEVQRLVWFRGVNVYQLGYVLKQYWGYMGREVRKFLRVDPKSRFTMLNKFPAYILTRHRVIMIDYLLKSKK